MDLSNVVTIGEKAFRRCFSLDHIIVSSAFSVGAYAFHGCTRLKEADLSRAATIGEGAFYFCTGLERVGIPSTASAIGARTLLSCAICDRAFHGCMRLKEVDLFNVAVIGEEVFWRCSSLEYLNIPSTVTAIGANAFVGCVK